MDYIFFFLNPEMLSLVKYNDNKLEQELPEANHRARRSTPGKL